MNEHPHDTLPALALGALDTNEAREVISHVAVCPTCRDDAEVWGAIVAMLPYAVPQSDPPTQVKDRLFTLVGLAAASQAAPAAARARGWPGGVQRWVGVVAAATLALMFGLLFADAQRRSGMFAAQVGQRDQQLSQMRDQIAQERQALTTQISQRDQQLSQMRDQIAREQQQVVFISADATIGQPLVQGQGAAQGKMYMQPGQKNAVLVVQGLKPLAAGKVYQFWFATASSQVPSKTFTVGPGGMATVTLVAPEAVDTYAQVMVTVEPESGSQTPSDEVVLQAEVST